MYVCLGPGVWDQDCTGSLGPVLFWEFGTCLVVGVWDLSCTGSVGPVLFWESGACLVIGVWDRSYTEIAGGRVWYCKTRITSFFAQEAWL